MPASLSPVRLVNAASSALLLAACASTATNLKNDRSLVLLSDRPAPRHGCEVLRKPGTLPGVDGVADSAALVSDVRAYAERERLADPKIYMLFSVQYAPDGTVDRVKQIEWFMPPDGTTELQGIVQRHLRAQPGGGALRLRIAPAPAPGAMPVVQVGRSEICEPHPLTRFSLLQPATAGKANLQEAVYRIRVAEDGRTIGMQQLRSTGMQEMDRFIERKLPEGRFEPGLIDGFPVAMDVEQRFRVRQR